jgi:hypothetical protein
MRIVKESATPDYYDVLEKLFIAHKSRELVFRLD